MPSAQTSALLKVRLLPLSILPPHSSPSLTPPAPPDPSHTPLTALFIYLLLTHLLLPYYRKYRERSSYHLLPSSLNSTLTPAANSATSLITRLVQSLSGAILRTVGNVNEGQFGAGVWRRDSADGGGFGIGEGVGGRDWGFGVGDEELVEGIVGLEGQRDVDGEGGRRLSRELESGFISDSSEEDGR